jgi:nicotinamidase-related amidase
LPLYNEPMAKTPSFCDLTRVGTLFYPEVSLIAESAREAGLQPASEDRLRVHLLVVDMQIDFTHEEGTLTVPGAMGDIRRLIDFIYRHAERISGITCSLDSHLPFQIFHSGWWSDEKGASPPPFTTIHLEDVLSGKWRALHHPDWSVKYLRKLQEGARKELTIWPYHVPIGGLGSALDPELWSAVFWHSLARGVQPRWWTKGSHPQTEHYSMLRPEVSAPGAPPGQESELLQMLREQDFIVLAGEAASHCVLETLSDLVEDFRDNPELLAKILLLKDCTSPVAHPEIDFAAIVENRFRQFEAEGVRMLRSTDTMPF